MKRATGEEAADEVIEDVLILSVALFIRGPLHSQGSLRFNVESPSIRFQRDRTIVRELATQTERYR